MFYKQANRIAFLLYIILTSPKIIADDISCSALESLEISDNLLAPEGYRDLSRGLYIHKKSVHFNQKVTKYFQKSRVPLAKDMHNKFCRKISSAIKIKDSNSRSSALHKIKSEWVENFKQQLTQKTSRANIRYIAGCRNAAEKTLNEFIRLESGIIDQATFNLVNRQLDNCLAINSRISQQTVGIPQKNTNTVERENELLRKKLANCQKQYSDIQNRRNQHKPVFPTEN